MQLAVVVDEQLAGDHPFFGVADDPPAGFHGGEQSVFSHDVAGVGVVGGDRGRDIAQRFVARVLGWQVVAETAAGQRFQPAADALAELVGGFAGEGQTQDVFGQDVAVGNEPDHARGHRLGLAGPGTGDDDVAALRWRADDRGLLRGGWVGLLEPPGGEFLGADGSAGWFLHCCLSLLCAVRGRVLGVGCAPVVWMVWLAHELTTFRPASLAGQISL